VLAPISETGAVGQSGSSVDVRLVHVGERVAVWALVDGAPALLALAAPDDESIPRVAVGNDALLPDAKSTLLATPSALTHALSLQTLSGVVEIDYGAGRLRLYPLGAGPPAAVEEGGLPVPIAPRPPEGWTTDTTLPGNPHPLTVLVDPTCANPPFEVTDSAPAARFYATLEAGCTTGTEPCYQIALLPKPDGTLESIGASVDLHLGPLTLANVGIAGLENAPTPLPGAPQSRLRLGALFDGKGRVVLDRGGRLLYLFAASP
jgi:hypothetical protein